MDKGTNQSLSALGANGDGDASRLGTQFLASLNHDIRTPLSGIVGMTDLLFETDLTEEQQEYVSTTKLCADQLLEMINAALEYAALSAGDVKLEEAEFHLAHALRTAMQEFVPKAEAKGLRIATHFDNSLPEYVIGDAVRLRQAIAPLLGNAVKFTHRGSIELSAGAGGEPEGDRFPLVISVRDTGIGIPQDELQNIFDSFHQLESGLSRSFPGMGLGLAVASKLAVILGGEISVESRPGAGSTFHLRIPLQLPPLKSSDSARRDAQGAPPEDGRPSILFVDDNEVARRIVDHILKRAGYRIECASGGAEGIEAAAARRYDLILMDLQMPNVNGLQATAAIRNMPGHRDTPILALTANYSEEFARACKDAGLREFLSKPIQRDELLRAVGSHLS